MIGSPYSEPANHGGNPPSTPPEKRGIRMAAKTKGSTKTKAKTEEVEEDVELEDLDTDAEADEDDGKSKAQEVEFGASDLAKYLSEKTGKTISPRELRALIRKMAREDTPRVDREIKAGNRSRYNWPGGL